MDRRLTRLIALLALLGALLVSACSPKAPALVNDVPTDYADSSNWLSRPATPSHEVATFYLYPTSYFGEGEWAPANDPGMRDQARQVFAVQGQAFRATDIYAPYYRQLGLAHLMTFFPDTVRLAEVVQDRPLVDARNAFDRFVAENLGDRPFILAAHSQGAIVAQGLLAWIAAERPELIPRLVAAYLIGVPLHEQYLAQVGVPFATGPRDTGVAISWSAESPDATMNPFVSIPPGLVINPISWTRDDTLATKEESRGSVVRFEFGEPGTAVEHFADARVDASRGTVVTTAAIEAQPPWPTGVLHRWDLDLYIEDVAHNVSERAAAYLAQR